MGNTVTISGKEFKVKNTLRAIFIFEEITGGTFKIETIRDNYLYFYSIILANNPDCVISWDEFIDAIDADPDIFKKMTEMLAEADKVQALLNGSDDAEGKKKE